MAKLLEFLSYSAFSLFAFMLLLLVLIWFRLQILSAINYLMGKATYQKRRKIDEGHRDWKNWFTWLKSRIVKRNSVDLSKHVVYTTSAGTAILAEMEAELNAEEKVQVDAETGDE